MNGWTIANLAAWMHRGQVRRVSGDPYVWHPGRVAMRLAVRGMPQYVVDAGWGHDLLEDTIATEMQIVAASSPETYALIVEVTNPSKQHKHLPRAERKAMDRDHLAKASWHARVLKLNDMFDNLSEMAGDDPDFVRLYCSEQRLLLERLSGTDPYTERLVKAKLASLERS